MKLQNINNWNNQPNAAKNIKPPNNSFESVLKSQVKNDRSNENTLMPAQTLTNTEQIDSVKHMTLSNINPIKLSGLKSLVKDAFSDTDKQILREIDSICADETGNSIDMKLIGELLELYTGAR